MRGVTSNNFNRIYDIAISTHTPHARRDGDKYTITLAEMQISTHTPHARRDFLFDVKKWHDADFNSHASCEA